MAKYSLIIQKMFMLEYFSLNVFFSNIPCRLIFCQIRLWSNLLCRIYFQQIFFWSNNFWTNLILSKILNLAFFCQIIPKKFQAYIFGWIFKFWIIFVQYVYVDNFFVEYFFRTCFSLFLTLSLTIVLRYFCWKCIFF